MRPVWCLALLAAMSALAACRGGGNGSGHPSPLSSTVTPAANVCRPNPAPATNSTNAAEFGFRQVDSPRAGDSVRSPLHVAGRANPFEGAYSVTVFDAGGSQLAARNFSKDNQAPAFSADVPFSVTTATPACVWVHERSGRDGSPVNVTQIPVTLLP